MTTSATNTGNPLRLQLGVIKAAVLMMSISLGLAAQAATTVPDRADNGPGTREEMRDNAGQRDGRRQMEGLHRQLALSETQESLWKNAQEVSAKLRSDFQSERQARHEKMQQTLEDKNPDLRALTKEMDKDQEARQEKHKTVREAWLKFYDALNAEQKQKASHFLLAQIGMMGMHPDAGHAGHERQAGERPDDNGGRRPQPMK